MSKAQQMRDRLASIAEKSRLEFESRKRDLEAEMAKGKVNMHNIKKGLKNNEIVDQPFLGELPALETPVKKLTSKSGTKRSGSKAASDHSFSIPNAAVSPNSQPVDPTILMPTGLRVSDWCFTGSFDSTPPVVKVNNVYENVRPLGRGTFGDVYLVKNVDDNKLFANKTIFCEKEDTMKEMLEEVAILRKNRHPCIIDIHDGFITAQPKILNIITSYCEAGDLAKLIASSRKSRMNIPENQIIKWSLQIALALHFLHENGTIHRDLKPNNVMLADGGDLVKVADFGLAVEVKSGSISALGEAGTPVYTAPEMIKGEKYSYPADCFSFGVMLHELLRLDLPFYGNTTGDLVKSILHDEPPAVPAHYSEEIKAICTVLLEKDPAKRLGFAGLLQDPLFQSKAAAFPGSYRPKAIEERIRRAHCRQLATQLENLPFSKYSSLTLASDIVASIEAEKRMKLESEAMEQQRSQEQGVNGDDLSNNDDIEELSRRKGSKGKKNREDQNSNGDITDAYLDDVDEDNSSEFYQQESSLDERKDSLPRVSSAKSSSNTPRSSRKEEVVVQLPAIH